MQKHTLLTHNSNIGFVYNSKLRSLKCLGQSFDNVSIFEIELYREIAINNYNNNHRTPDKIKSNKVCEKLKKQINSSAKVKMNLSAKEQKCKKNKNHTNKKCKNS